MQKCIKILQKDKMRSHKTEINRIIPFLKILKKLTSVHV